MEGKNEDFLIEMRLKKKEKKCFFPEAFQLFKGPGRAHAGPYGPKNLTMNQNPENTPKIIENTGFPMIFQVRVTLGSCRC